MFTKINLAGFGKPDLLSNFYTLYGPVDCSQAQAITEWILSLNYAPVEEQPEVMNLLINSQGGSLTDAWAIIDMMRGSHIPIRTIGIGQIASAGLLIFMSGTKGRRILTENTSIMSHQYGWGAAGKHHELLAIQKEYVNTQKRLIIHLTKCTGLSEEEVNEKLMPASDVYLTGKEALKLGIADSVASLY